MRRRTFIKGKEFVPLPNEERAVREIESGVGKSSVSFRLSDSGSVSYVRWIHYSPKIAAISQLSAFNSLIGIAIENPLGNKTEMLDVNLVKHVLNNLQLKFVSFLSFAIPDSIFESKSSSCSLEIMKLVNCQLDDSNLLALKNFASLQTLNLSWNCRLSYSVLKEVVENSTIKEFIFENGFKNLELLEAIATRRGKLIVTV